MTLGGAAQLAAAHALPERTTLNPAVCSQTDPPMPQPAALRPSPHEVCDVKNMPHVRSECRVSNNGFRA